MVYTPLSLVIPPELWPAGLFGDHAAALGFLDNLACLAYDERGSEQSLSIFLQAEVMAEARLAMPFLDGMELVLGRGDTLESRRIDVDLALQGADDGPPTLELAFATNALSLSLRQDLFRPVELIPEGDKLVVRPLARSLSIPLPFTLRLSYVDDDWSLACDLPTDQPSGLYLPPCMIGDTGVIIEATGIVPNFSGLGSRPAGAPEGWRGLYLGSVSLYLPDLLTEPISVTGLGIGTGGLYGSLDLPVDLTARLGGIELTLSRVALAWAQNIPTEAAIAGNLTLPFFNQPLAVAVGLGVDGRPTLSVAGTGDLAQLTIPGVLELTVDGLGLELEGGLFTARVAGQLTPLFGDLDWPTFRVEELAIDSRGNVRLEGGWLNLREQYALDFYGFKLEITKLGFGNTDDGRKWIGCSGGLSLVEGLPAGASVEGLRIIWRDGDPGSTTITLNGVGVKFEVPNVLTFAGFVAYNTLTASDGTTIHRFDGTVSLTLEALKGLAIDARLVVGRASDNGRPYNYFAIYVGVELPTGIPLGATGLALYGFSGLFATQMVPNKRAEEAWYENADGTSGWFKREPVGVTDLFGKWGPRAAGLALGGGVTLGTYADNGFIFSGKVLLAIVFPGPIILIEGKANLLRERAALSGPAEPLFRMLGVIDAQASHVLFALAARFRYDEAKAALIDVSGAAEVFFSWAGARDWHIYLGVDEPPARRIHAKVFKLLKAESYLMIAPGAFKLGVYIGFDKAWKFGPLAVTLQAWIAGSAALSWRPAHFVGSLELVGKVALRVYRFSLGLSLEALLSAEVFDPYHLLGRFAVGIDLPWPLPDFRASITLEWGPELSPPVPPDALKEIAAEHLMVTATWPLALRRIAGEQAGPSDAELPVVPLDARPSVSFNRPVYDAAAIGVNAQPPPTAWEWIGDAGHGPAEVRYDLAAMTLERASGDVWQVVAGQSATYDQAGDRWTRDAGPADVPPLYGAWAPVPRDDRPGEVGQTKLLLFSKTPFEFTRSTDSSWDEWFLAEGGPPAYPCPPPVAEQRIRCTFDAVDPDLPIETPWRCPRGYLRLGWSANPALRGIPPDADEPDLPLFGLYFAVDEAGHPAEQIIWAALERPAARVVFHVRSSLRAAVTWFDAAGQGHDLLAQDDARSIEIPGPDVVGVKIRSGWSIWLAAVEVVIGPDPADLAERVARVEHMRSELQRWQGPDDVFQVNAVYRLRVRTRWTMRKHPPLAAGTDHREELWEAYFKTSGPPGVAPQPSRPRIPGAAASVSTDPAAPQVTDLSSGLEDLRPYVRQTSPPTIPVEVLASAGTISATTGSSKVTGANVSWTAALAGALLQASGDRHTYQIAAVDPQGAELTLTGPYNGASLSDAAYTISRYDQGRPLLPRPVYRTDRVWVDFNENYVERMYDLAGYTLWLGLYDQNSVPVRDLRGQALQLVPDWLSQPAPVLTEGGQRWLARFGPGSSPCFDDTSVEVLPDQTLATPDHAYLLEPASTYEARLEARSEGAATGEVVYRFAFVSSRFADFFHQAHSFPDRLWGGSRLADQDWSRLAAGQPMAETPGGEPGSEEVAGYDALALGVLGQAAWQQPAELEITSLAGPGEDEAALLVRSPEPIDWRVTGVVLERDDGSESPPIICAQSPTTLKLTSVDLGAAAGNELSVRLLLLEDADLSGWQIRFRPLGASSEEAWSTYYTFVPETPPLALRSGVRVRVYGGGATEGLPDVPHTLQRFAGGSDGGSPALPAQGVELQLVGPDGRVAHQRGFRPDSYAPLTTSMLRKGDGTGFGVAPLSAAALATGSYRLRFVRRATASGGDPETVTLDLPGAL